jgi:hypothetical protein
MRVGIVNLELLIDRYCEAWSHASASTRKELIEETVAEDGIYCDPRTPPLNRGDLIAHINRVRLARPGDVVVRTGPVDAHHGMARFSWHAVAPDGRVLVTGVDFVELDPGQERLRCITGFFDPS